jgi:hypothetical protein
MSVKASFEIILSTSFGRAPLDRGEREQNEILEKTCDAAWKNRPFGGQYLKSLTAIKFKPVCILKNGAQGRSRTTDTAIFSRMLYQLSYLGALHSSAAGL